MKPIWKIFISMVAFVPAADIATVAQQTPPPATGPATLIRRVAADAGSTNAPLLFCIGLHIEPFGATPSKLVGGSERPRSPAGGPGFGKGARQPDYHTVFFFRKHIEDICTVADLVERHGGRLTVQAQTPFTEMLAQENEKLLAELEKRGHEIGLHFHEDAHLGRNGGALPVATWARVMQEEIGLLKQAGATRVRYWSGGNLYPGVLDAAATAGLDVMSDYKNPRSQRADEKLLAVGPWRPSAGPKENDVADFAKHSASGKIIYLPDGVFPRSDFNSMRRAETPGGDWAYFDFLTESLEMSLRAAQPDRVNVFHITVHAGEFRGGRGDMAKPFAVIDRWLAQVVEPLVKAGKMKWATFSQMADAFKAWEKKNPDVAPRASSATKSAGATGPGERSAGLGSGALENDRENSNAPDRSPALQGKGCITFVVNTHDWGHPDESADTILRLIGLFERYRVRGDFYLTAPITDAYAQKRPEVIRRLQDSGMTISYHVRAPHPLWSGFGGPLRGLDEQALAATLRDYETYRLDLRTGKLNHDQPGGYAYVAKVLGKTPVAVGASDDNPRVKDAALRNYATLGARMAVLYHESGTDLDQPFAYRAGLLARPSDFSITRFPLPGNPRGVFWWNMLDTPRAAEFDPLTLLKTKLAEWRAPRPPFITCLIHENDFCRANGPGWNSIYFEGEGNAAQPRQAPFDLNAPDRSRQRSAQNREAIFKKYEELVAYAAQNLRVVTSEDIVAMAKQTSGKANRADDAPVRRL